MAVPISQYVLKVHSRCNLACNHCYVYEHADQSWRAKPRFISPRTAARAATRIGEHAAAHGLANVFVVLHGGEPLLIGKARMRALLDVLSSRIGSVAGLDLRIHSNGVLLDEQWCDLFSEYQVKVGVSLDGDQTANDLHRVFADGRSSYPETLGALALLRRPEYRSLYAGILCTIDLAADPVVVYRALTAQQPPNLDLLLPHATWEHPPYRPAGQPSPYADWLMRVYECWNRDGRRVPIRIFDSLLSAAGGGVSFTEALGTDPGDLLVIDTDGGWEQPDSMKTAFDGAAATGMNVFGHPVDRVRAHPAIASRQGGIAALSPTCRACSVVRVCGGGLYAHRFRPARRGDQPGPAEFDHPSVYCADLKTLIDQVMATERKAAERMAAAKMAAPSAGTRPDVAEGEPPTPGSRPAHALPVRAFDRLAAGPGDVASVRTLTDLRLSEVRSLVAAVAAGEEDWRDASLRQAAAEGWALLCALARDHQREVDEVLAHPYTYTWAVRCLRPPPGADTDLDRAHLAGLAAAAAYRAGVAAELPVPVRDRHAYLPAAGAIAVGRAPGPTEIVTVAPGRPPSARGGGRWHRTRCLDAAPFGRLAVEDLDPFRDCQGWPAAGRLPRAEWQAWRRDLAVAGRQLSGLVPGYARTFPAGLRAVVPLRPDPGGGRSATARQAFGAVAIARPGEQAREHELSELVLHEFQHVKLDVLLGLRVLFQPGPAPRFLVPWRPDPRPKEGALHGTYAYLALTHLRAAQGPAARVACLRYRSWVGRTADELLGTRGMLTELGERFVSGMATAAEGVLA
jgi:uncharacterized protein